jgi:hypothetical protein
MADRIDVEEARRRVSRGGALLVCAYADESRCERIRLEGSISLAQLEGLVETLPRDREIVFYCA